MRLRPWIRLAGWSLALMAGPVQAGAPVEHPETSRCTPAAIADVVLAAPVPVDEIRVVVADGSPAAGAAEVTLEAGGDAADRVVHILGASQGLSFSPALTSRAFRVSLLPDLSAARDACVDRIELRRGGAPVATIVP